MKIETKYNIGDIFWKMESNKAQSFVVREIQIQVTKGSWLDSPKVQFTYFDHQGPDWIRGYEDDIFPTKEALLASL